MTKQNLALRRGQNECLSWLYQKCFLGFGASSTSAGCIWICCKQRRLGLGELGVPFHLFLNVWVGVRSTCSQQPYQNFSRPGNCTRWANIQKGPPLPAQGISETLGSIKWSHFLLRLSVNLCNSLHLKYFQLPWSFEMLLPFSLVYINFNLPRFFCFVICLTTQLHKETLTRVINLQVTIAFFKMRFSKLEKVILSSTSKGSTYQPSLIYESPTAWTWAWAVIFQDSDISFQIHFYCTHWQIRCSC